MSSSSRCSFQILPYELKEHILKQFLNTSQLSSLALVSRHLNEIATPYVYSNVSLLLRVTQAPIRGLPQIDDSCSLLHAQKSFVATIKARCDLGLYVRTLEWQVLAGEEDKVAKEELVESSLHLLSNVRTAHVVLSHPQFWHQRSDMFSGCGPIFPHVTSLKLVNVPANIGKFFLPSSAQITELSLDTVFISNVAPALLHLLLVGTHFPALRKLSIRLLRQDSEGSAVAVSVKYAAILMSVRATLEHVLLGFRSPLPMTSVMEYRDIFVPPVAEKALVEQLVPVFANECWPKLRLVEVEGARYFPGPLWGSLEAVVPRLKVDHNLRLAVDTWDPERIAKF